MTLATSVEQVYAFHENPHNLLEISPAWLDARIEHASTIAKQGEDFLLRVGLRGIPPKLSWLGYWEEANRPGLLIDGAKKGPFQYWQHQHRFESLGPALTRMTDHVTYRFPGGFLGKIFGETLGRLQFHVMFWDRHRRTQRWMREHGNKHASPASPV